MKSSPIGIQVRPAHFTGFLAAAAVWICTSSLAHAEIGDAGLQSENTRIFRAALNEHNLTQRKLAGEIAASRSEERRDEGRGLRFERFDAVAAVSRERAESQHDGPPALAAEAHIDSRQLATEARSALRLLAVEESAARKMQRDEDRRARLP